MWFLIECVGRMCSFLFGIGSGEYSGEKALSKKVVENCFGVLRSFQDSVCLSTDNFKLARFETVSHQDRLPVSHMKTVRLPFSVTHSLPKRMHTARHAYAKVSALALKFAYQIQFKKRMTTTSLSTCTELCGWIGDAL